MSTLQHESGSSVVGGGPVLEDGGAAALQVRLQHVPRVRHDLMPRLV